MNRNGGAPSPLVDDENKTWIEQKMEKYGLEILMLERWCETHPLF